MEISGEPYKQRHLGDYLGFVRRQWYIVALALVIGVVLAVALLKVLPKTYESTASVLVKPTIVTGTPTNGRTVTQVNLDTEAQVVKSVPVSTEVKKRLSSPLTASKLASYVSIAVPPNTTIMNITYAAGTASVAKDGAQTYAEAYIDYQTQQAKDQVDAQLKVLDDNFASTAKDISALNKKIAANVLDTAATKDAQQSLLTLQRRSTALSSRRIPLETASTTAGSVIDSASTPSRPASPNPKLVGASSVALLLLLGLLLAWARDRRRGKIRHEDEIESEAHIEVLGTVHDTRLIDGTSRRSRRRADSSTQHYRQIVHAISARIDVTGGALLVTGIGGTTLAQEVAHTLGVAMARTGSNVLLIGSDGEPTWSASSTSDGEGSPAELATTSLTGAHLKVNGNVLTTELGSYLEELESSWRRVLLSTPPMGRSADAQAIAPFVQLTVLVLELNRATRTELADAMRQLRQVGTSTVVAIVLDGVPARAQRASSQSQSRSQSRSRSQSQSPAPAVEPTEQEAVHDDSESADSIHDERVTGLKRRG